MGTPHLDLESAMVRISQIATPYVGTHRRDSRHNFDKEQHVHPQIAGWYHPLQVNTIK